MSVKSTLFLEVLIFVEVEKLLEWHSYASGIEISCTTGSPPQTDSLRVSVCSFIYLHGLLYIWTGALWSRSLWIFCALYTHGWKCSCTAMRITEFHAQIQLNLEKHISKWVANISNPRVGPPHAGCLTAFRYWGIKISYPPGIALGIFDS